MEREVSSEREQATTNRAGFPVRLGRGRIEEIPLTKYLFVILCDTLSKQQVNSAGKLVSL